MHEFVGEWHSMTMDLFSRLSSPELLQERLGPGSAILRGFALADEAELLAAVESIAAKAPFRHMVTPGGFEMSVAMSNCGSYGWVTDRTGYRYDALDPLSGQPWPCMPDVFAKLAANAAAQAGYHDFSPDACLLNRYESGARMSLHQDKNERDFSQPIVSVSLGVSAMFLFGGFKRADKPARVPLNHGDVVVWGGPDRMRYHGVLPVKQAHHPLLGSYRVNLTFRKAS
jgi:alkylated DNA repair protein (DNA oxidative demethylase)